MDQRICFSGVMGFPQTSMRDPIFYRWHTFVESFFLRYKVNKPGFILMLKKEESIALSIVVWNLACELS